MRGLLEPLYTTSFGAAYVGDALELLQTIPNESVDLVLTSPPFALQRQKNYDSVDQERYVDWLLRFSQDIKRVLKDTGSFVIDVGGAYKKGRPVRSLHNYRFIIAMCDELGWSLAQEFFWHNPSRLPSPIEWVNKRKIRVKDSVNTIWWLSKTDFPKVNVDRVRASYSERMKVLLRDPDKYYKPSKRPSGHNISTKFANDLGGPIPSNLLSIPNTESNSKYLRLCRATGVEPHPARFPQKVPIFFISLLTEEGDTVLDIFSGSNATGAAAESLRRKWIAFDINRRYVAASAFRFLRSENVAVARMLFETLMLGDSSNVHVPSFEQHHVSFSGDLRLQ